MVVLLARVWTFMFIRPWDGYARAEGRNIDAHTGGLGLSIPFFALGLSVETTLYA